MVLPLPGPYRHVIRPYAVRRAFDCHTDRAEATMAEASLFACIACVVAGRRDAPNLATTVPLLHAHAVRVALYTYDGSASWYNATQTWYARLCDARDVPPTRTKWPTCLHELPRTAFSHIWFLDADVVLYPSGLRDMLRAVRTWDLPILQPSISGSDHAFLRPSPSCDVRATNFVEVQAPLVRVSVVQMLRPLLPGRRQMDWGVDMVWCRYVRAHLRVPHACGVVNSNFRHAPSPSRRYNVSEAVMMMNCMEDSLAAYWIQEQRDRRCLERRSMRFGVLPRLRLY